MMSENVKFHRLVLIGMRNLDVACFYSVQLLSQQQTQPFLPLLLHLLLSQTHSVADTRSWSHLGVGWGLRISEQVLLCTSVLLCCRWMENKPIAARHSFAGRVNPEGIFHLEREAPLKYTGISHGGTIQKLRLWSTISDHDTGGA